MSPLGTVHQPRWVVLLQVVTIAAGLALGTVARPDALPALVLAAALQAAATVIGGRAVGGPIAYAGAVTVATIAVAAHPALRELLHLGAVPYLHLGIALATFALARRARTGAELSLGAGLLVIASVLTAVSSMGQGAPAAMSLLSASVPMLGGGLVATASLLRLARADRLTRSRDRRDPSPPPAPGTDADRAASSLVQVALASERLAEDPPDRRTALWAAELQRIALRGLPGGVGDADGSGRVRLELRIDHGEGPAAGNAATSDRAAPTDAPEVATPDLSDREHEIARLLTSGASNAAIARELYLSEATIKGHVSRMMRRFDCDNRTQLALLATRWSL